MKETGSAPERHQQHPSWCAREFCTAFCQSDREYHRTAPIIVPTEDPGSAIFVHAGADADGSGLYVEVAELDLPLTHAFYLCVRKAEPRPELLMTADVAKAVHAALSATLPVLKARVTEQALPPSSKL